jgi:type IV secretory pathway VirB4 component
VKVAAHEATTAQLGAAFPFVSTRPLPGAGVLIGRDLLGAAFVHDPFELYRAGVLTNPNMLVIGQIGRGKSAFIKSYLYRHAAFGRRLVVFDPKGEYGPLAKALGVRPITLRPGGEVRLNPLGVPAGDRRSAADRRRDGLAALVGVASAAVRRVLVPSEHAALELAFDAASRRSSSPTMPLVVDALLFPELAAAQLIAEQPETLHRHGRDVALELRRLVSGELAGMFDGETSAAVDLGARVVVIDLSALYRSDALGVVVACARGALEAALQRAGEEQTILVVDEAWAVLSNPGATSFLQSSFKLARAFGVANIAVCHRISDLQSSGGAGSAARAITEGLLADCETVVCYAQSPAELAVTRAALGLGAEEARLVAGLRRGVALWRVGTRSFLVEHHLGAAEHGFVDTDQRLLGANR